MESNVETRLKQYLRKRFQYQPVQAGTLVYLLRNTARVTGHDLDQSFAGIGLAAGAQAKIAAEVCGRALGLGTYTAAERVVKKHLDELLRKHPNLHVTSM